MTTPQPPKAEGPQIVALNITSGFAKALAEFQTQLPIIATDKLVEVETKKEDADDYEYTYATLPHVTKEVIPALAKHGLSFTSFVSAGSRGAGLSLHYFLIHESGGFIGAEWPISATEAKGIRGMQDLGGKITFIRRYALQAATGVAAEEDDNLRAALEREEQTPTAQRRQRSQAARTTQAEENTARRRQRQRAEEPDEEVGPPRDPLAPISQGQQTKLVMQFGDLGKREPQFREGDAERQRQRRLWTIGRLIGREITTMKMLNMGEAHEVITVLNEALASDQPRVALAHAADAVAHRTGQPADDTPPPEVPQGDQTS